MLSAETTLYLESAHALSPTGRCRTFDAEADGAVERIAGALALKERRRHALQKMADHPEWFAMQPNGSRDQSKLGPERSRFCVSNPELIEAIAAEKIEELTLYTIEQEQRLEELAEQNARLQEQLAALLANKES